MLGIISEVEMFIRSLPTTLLQLFFTNTFNSKGVIKSINILDPDNTF